MALCSLPLSHNQVILYVDLHGHSNKHNIFNYGCHDHDCDHTQFLNERVFCFLLSQLVSYMMSLSCHVIHIPPLMYLTPSSPPFLLPLPPSLPLGTR